MDSQLKVSFQTFGCRSNFADTVDLVALASERGAQVSEFEKNQNADVYVINSCTVTDVADKEAIKFIEKLKRDQPNSKLVLTGCLAEAKTEQMKKLFPDIEVLGPGQKNNVLNAIFGEEKTDKRLNEKPKNLKIRTPSHKTISLDDDMPSQISGPASLIGKFKLRSRYHLRIQEGCENHCTFCIIPQTRGELSSRSVKDIISDLKILKEKGYNEIVLTGTHLGGYGQDCGESLLSLLKSIDSEIEGPRIRLSSLDPNDVSFEIIDFISKSNIFCNHLHICLQAFTDSCLKRMNRKYRMEDAKELLWYINSRFSGCGIGSDIITGFPGEGRKELEEGIEEFLSLPISYLHVFPYSEREGTSATRLDQVIPVDERKRRAARWRALAERKRADFLKTLVNKELDIIVEDKVFEDGSQGGTSSEYADVRLYKSRNNIELKSNSLNCIPGQRVKALAVNLDLEGNLICEL